jgi:predicted transcriptional regulator
MTLKEIKDILKATAIYQPDNYEDMTVQSACCADLMSDVLYYHAPHSLLITGLTQSSVIRTAEIAGITAIVFVFNKKPDSQTIELARQKKIPLFSTPLCMYNASGILHEAGLQGS